MSFDSIFMEPIEQQTKKKMEEAFNMLSRDFATVRTGKANSGLVEEIMVNAYNGTTRLKVVELATIHVADSQTIVITPFDHSVLNEIENAITSTGVGLSPVVDGNIIRVSIPPLTEERRREFVKLVNQKAESGKVMIRQIRHEAMEEIKKQKDNVSEDDIERWEKEIQRLTDNYVEKIDNLRGQKEEELMRL